MLMRAVFASAMLIGLAGTAQSEIRIIYPPYSYEPPMKICDYVLGDCYLYDYGYRQNDYGYRHYYQDMTGVDAVIPAYANIAKVVVILPPSVGERSRHRSYKSW